MIVRFKQSTWSVDRANHSLSICTTGKVKLLDAYGPYEQFNFDVV